VSGPGVTFAAADKNNAAASRVDAMVTELRHRMAGG
jgi:hypothetical protein